MREFLLTIRFALLAFLLNFFWEAWHAYYLYWGYRGRSFSDYAIPEYLALIEKVAFVDAGILIAVFLVGFLIWKDWEWFTSMAVKKWVYYFVLTVGVAIWIELKGVHFLQEWSYLDTMPTIFGLGLSPLLQLAATGLIAFWMLKQLKS